jgi:hypothetical protein
MELLDDYECMNARGYFPARRESRWCLGWDPAQSGDSSALVLCERVRLPVEPENNGVDAHTLRQRLSSPIIYVRHLERLPQRMTYPSQLRYVKSLLTSPQLRGKRVELVIDRTGVGRAIGDQAKEMGLHPTLLTITSGSTPGSDDDGALRIPKLELVSRLQSCLHNGELRYPSRHPETAELMRQLASFTATMNASGAASFEGANSHDDYPLALSYCTYQLRMRPGNSYTVTPLSEIL